MRVREIWKNGGVPEACNLNNPTSAERSGAQCGVGLPLSIKACRRYATVILLVLLVAGWNIATAQTPHFPTHNASWSVYSFSNYQSDTLEYYLAGDTILYDASWSKLFHKNLQGDVVYCGAIKESEDIVEIKLPDEEKRVLYDFTLAVGDTFPYSPFHFGWDVFSVMVVERIDTVQLINGEFRREIVSNMVTSGIFEEIQERWIEGVGSIHGPLFPLNPKLLDVECNEEFTLVCYSEDDELLYHNLRFASCMTATEIEDAWDNDWGVQIYPNPARDHIVISTADNIQIRTITIYDSLGKNVMKVTNTSEIDISGLKTGIYLCEIDFGDYSKAYKFIKN
jgi:hypothetical protein